MNFRETELRDGPEGDGWIAKMPQFSIFRQLEPQEGPRIKVHYFASRIAEATDGWVDARDLGPVDPPGEENPREPDFTSPPGGGGRWLSNHRKADLRSGDGETAPVVARIPQFSILAQLAPQIGQQIPVYYYGNSRLQPCVGWAVAADLGPIHQPLQVPPPEPESPEDAPLVFDSPSPNHGGIRAQTLGCVIHSTRGGAPSVEQEFRGTLEHFKNPGSQVSSHIVIAADGTIANVVDPDLVAFHAGFHNSSMLGIELVQPRIGDEVTDAQYRSCALWLTEMSNRFGFALVEGNLPEHRQTAQGTQVGKTDVNLPYSFHRLKMFLDEVS
jgi:hypothetical protein